MMIATKERRGTPPRWHWSSLASALIKCAVGLATFGAANPTVVTDSSGVDIDPEFTWEIVNETCGGNFFRNTVEPKLQSVTTEHVEPTSGETIYMTSFGGLDAGHVGRCNYSQTNFLNALDLTGDFSLSDTARVYWANDNNKNAVGLDFLRKTDSQVLGVPCGCDFDRETPIQITSASELTLQFGYQNYQVQKVLLTSINGRPGSSEAGSAYPFTNSGNDECKAQIIIRKGALSEVQYLGTQSNTNQALVDTYQYVGAIGIYYRRCAPTVNFLNKVVQVEAGYGQLATSAAIQQVTTECDPQLNWSLTETTLTNTLTIQNEDQIPLTLDSTTDPTQVIFSEFPLSPNAGDEYTFQVKASHPDDVTFFAQYVIKVIIVMPCTIATFLPGQVQDDVPPEWAAYDYSGYERYLTDFDSDQPYCYPVIECSTSPTLPSGDDLCNYTDPEGTLMSESYDGTYWMDWIFHGSDSDRATMAEIPPGTYTVTMTAKIEEETNLQLMSHSFSITFVDPCLQTVLSFGWSHTLPVQYGVKDPALDIWAWMTDSVSETHGNLDAWSFCGPRNFILQTSSEPWATLDEVNGLLKVESSDISLIGFTETVDVMLELKDYPTVAPEFLTIDIEFIKGCSDAILTVPAPIVSSITYFTWDPIVSQDFEAMINAASLDVTQNCGLYSATWFQDSDGDLVLEPLDTNVYTEQTPSDLDIYSIEETKVGTYNLFFSVYLVDYINVISQQETKALTVVIKDRCSPEGGMQFTQATFSSEPGPYFFTGVKLEIDASSQLVTNFPGMCPNKLYECEVIKPDLTTMDCNQSQGVGTTVSTFDLATGVFEFLSTDPNNNIYLQDSQYLVQIRAFAGQLSDNIFATATLTLDLPCMIEMEDFVWTIEPIVLTEFVIRDYLASPTYDPYVVAPFSSPPFLDDQSCALIAPIEYYTTYVSSVSAAIVSGPFASSEANVSLSPLPIGTITTLTFSIDFANLFANQGHPEVERIVEYVDGHKYLELDFYTQLTPVPIDISLGSVQIVLTPPRFKERAENGGMTAIELLDPQDPLRELTFQINGLTLEESTLAVIFTEIDNTRAGEVVVQFAKREVSLLDSFDVVFCYKYSDWENLSGLCDEQVLHPVTNAVGTCFSESSIELEAGIVQTLESEAIVQTLGADSLTVVEIVAIASVQTPGLVCGEFAYILADETQSAFVTVDSTTGLVTLESISDSDLVGTHIVQVMAYLHDIDPGAKFQKLVPLTLSVIIEEALIDELLPEVVVTKAPPVSLEPIAAVYEAQFDETQFFSFSFADQQALDGDVDESELGGLLVRITINTIAGVVQLGQLEYAKVGYANLLLQADGAKAAQQLLAADVVDSSVEGDMDTGEDSETTNSVMGQVTIEVEDLSQGGLISTFTLKFKFVAESEKQVLDESEEEKVELAQSQAIQNEKMLAQLFRAFKTPTIQADPVETVKIEAKLREIDQVGTVFVDFSPNIVQVPNDWEKLWSLDERNKMSPKDSEEFEKELKKIMHVQFIHNTDEEPQRYLMSNLTTFTNDGISINLNFSDPILVSQGETADKVQINLLKAYFLVPEPNLASGRARSLDATAAPTIIENDEYIIIEHEIPRQIRSLAESVQLTEAAEAIEGVLTTGFAFTFALNLALSGVMSQLWSIFNTLQIIMALHMLAIILPANVIAVQDIVNAVINFQVVDKKTLTGIVIEPIFGETEQQDDAAESKDPSYSFEEQSLLLQLLQLLLGMIVAGILIALLVFCKAKLMPRCCLCFQKIVNFAMAKLMFNSILRALMQTYLQTCLSLWFSFGQTNLGTSEGKVDFGLACAMIVFAIGFIVFSYKFLQRKKDNLREPTFKAKYDSLYQNVEYYKKEALANTSFFLLRRLLFAALIVFCGPSLVLQVFIADILSTLLLIFFISVKPMVDQWSNLMQIMNELVVLTCVWMMFVFSNYVPSAEVRYELAYFFLYLIAADVVLNVLYLVYSITTKVYRACRSKCARHKASKAIKMNVKDQTTATQTNKMTETEKFLIKANQKGLPGQETDYLCISSESSQKSQLSLLSLTNLDKDLINTKVGVSRPKMIPNKEQALAVTVQNNPLMDMVLDDKQQARLDDSDFSSKNPDEIQARLQLIGLSSSSQVCSFTRDPTNQQPTQQQPQPEFTYIRKSIYTSEDLFGSFPKIELKKAVDLNQRIKQSDSDKNEKVIEEKHDRERIGMIPSYQQGDNLMTELKYYLASSHNNSLSAEGVDVAEDTSPQQLPRSLPQSSQPSRLNISLGLTKLLDDNDSKRGHGESDAVEMVFNDEEPMQLAQSPDPSSSSSQQSSQTPSQSARESSQVYLSSKQSSASYVSSSSFSEVQQSSKSESSYSGSSSMQDSSSCSNNQSFSQDSFSRAFLKKNTDGQIRTEI